METTVRLPSFDFERLELRLPLLAPALGLWLGAALPRAAPSWPFVALLACGSLAALWLRPGRLWLALLVASLGLGALRLRGETERIRCPPPDAPPERSVATLVSRAPEPGGREALTVELQGLGDGARPLRCRALLSTGRRPAPGTEGDLHWLPAVSWEPPARLVNPGSGDGSEAFRSRGIERVGSLPDGAGVVVIGDGGPSLLGRAGRARRAFAAWAAEALSPGDATDVALSASSGARGRLSPDLADRLRLTGLGHLALPGAFALAVLLVLARLLWRWLWARSERLTLALPAGRAADLACLPLPALWALAIGPEGSPLRAAALATGWLFARAIGRGRPRGLHPWTLAALVTLALEPAWASDPRLLQLAALLLGLWVMGPPLAARLGGPPSAPALRRTLGALVAYVLAGTLASLPLAFASGHRLALLSPAAQLLGLVPAALLAATSLLARLAFLVSPAVALIPLALAHVAARALVALAASSAAPALPMPEPSPWLWPALALGVLSLGLALRGQRRALLPAVALALVFAGGLAFERQARRGILRLTFLSVGQGDGEVIELPDGETLVLDAGGSPTGSFDPGREIVAPYLWSRGLWSLRAAILSHPHPDHANGLPFLLSSFEVGELWSTGQPCAIAACEAIDRIARERSIPRRRFGSRREAFQLGGVTFEALHPIGPEGYLPELGENDNSLVLRLTYGAFTALLPGDVEAPAEERLLASGDDLHATWLKAPHHGSDTSSTGAFIARVAPQAVVFCVGPRNHFGFPRPEIVERYRAVGARTIRTDLDGAVTVETVGRSWSVRTAERSISRPEGEGSD
ncbi:MAG: MBL fold metallo-hydrolase [Deltaproteobacteria bacterium]